MRENPFEAVRAFVSERLFMEIERLTKDMDLVQLGLDGNDALEFMEAFRDKFGVDMSEFKFSEHFGPEAGLNPFYYIYCLLFARDKLRKLPITLDDLAEAAKNKRWICKHH